jgi:hypothetical protein
MAGRTTSYFPMYQDALARAFQRPGNRYVLPDTRAGISNLGHKKSWSNIH